MFIRTSEHVKKMSSILRISGELLDIDRLLSLYSIPCVRCWKKGEPRAVSGRVFTESGVNFLVSGADFHEFDRQVSEATEYLEQHAQVIAEMVAFPGVEHVVLDFGVSLCGEKFTQCSFIPPKLVRLAASAGLGLEISHYASSVDCEES